MFRQLGRIGYSLKRLARRPVHVPGRIALPVFSEARRPSADVGVLADGRRLGPAIFNALPNTAPAAALSKMHMTRRPSFDPTGGSLWSTPHRRSRSSKSAVRHAGDSRPARPTRPVRRRHVAPDRRRRAPHGASIEKHPNPERTSLHAAVGWRGRHEAASAL